MDCLQLRCTPNPWWSGVQFLLRDKSMGGGKVAYAKPVEMVLVDPLLEPFEERGPTFKLEKEAAQILMDDLWNCGIRPSEGSGSAGAFAAQGKHLEDFRALVARSYGVELIAPK